MPNNKARVESPKRIQPSTSLTDYLDETLRLERMRNKKLDNIVDNKDVRNNDEKKVRMLDKLFTSMADLIYFFEFLGNHPELVDKFGEDIEDLLGLKVTEDSKHRAFERFIGATISSESSGGQIMSEGKFNFQRRLIAIMQSIIHISVFGYFLISQEAANFKGMAHDDLTRAEVWTKFIDRPTPYENKKPNRLLGF